MVYRHTIVHMPISRISLVSIIKLRNKKYSHSHHIILLHSTEIFPLTKVYLFFNGNYHTSFQEPKLCVDSITPTSVSLIQPFLLLIVGN